VVTIEVLVEAELVAIGLHTELAIFLEEIHQ
jgi:hypothetical protein